MKTNPLRIELLESRIAPASLLPYTDIDGDKVVISSTLGNLTGHATIIGGQLQLLDLSDPSFNGASISFAVTKVAGGDGLAAVGRINGGANNLGTVTVKGDLGNIDGGGNTVGTPAIRSLSARSMGRYGLATQGSAGNLQSGIHGALGRLTVSGDVKDAFINVFGGTSSTLGAVTIGGSLVGGSGDFSGAILSSGDMGLVKIGHDLQGGSGNEAGFVNAGGKLAGVTIGGSLLGGSNTEAGKILSTGDMGLVKIGHDVQGGSGDGAGLVFSNDKLAGVTIGGSLLGGSNFQAGQIYSKHDMGLVKIGHDLLGGSGLESGFVYCSLGNLSGVTIGGSLLGGSNTEAGAIFSVGDIGLIKIAHDFRGASITSGSLDQSAYIQGARIVSVMIGGSVVAGTNDGAGSLTSNTSIRARQGIGSIVIKGSVIGSVGSGGQITNVIFSARSPDFAPSSNVAIGKIRIGGRVERTQILAGYDFDLSPVNGDAQIGSIGVGGDWIASDLIAGVADGGAVGFGDAGDTIIGGGASLAKISSIIIGGIVEGTTDLLDRFGFESHAIGSLKIHGAKVPIVSPVSLSPITLNDVTVRLV